MTFNLRLNGKSNYEINEILNENYKDAQLKYKEEIEKLNKEIEKLNKEVEIEIVDGNTEEFPKNFRLKALRNQFNFNSKL